MSGNIKFRWFLLVPILLAIFIVVTSPVVSFAGELADAQERVRQKPNDAKAHSGLGFVYGSLGRYQEAIAPLKEAIRLDPNNALDHIGLGFFYKILGRHQEAIASYKEAIRLYPNSSLAHSGLGVAYELLGHDPTPEK